MAALQQHTRTLIGRAELFAAAAMTLVWLASYWVSFRIALPGASTFAALQSYRGGLYLIHGREPNPKIDLFHAELAVPMRLWPINSPPAPGSAEEFIAFGRFAGSAGSAVRIPMIAIVAALLTAWMWHRDPLNAITFRSRSRRHPSGHCQHCGYNLCASTERCPECGQLFAVPISPSDLPPRPVLRRTGSDSAAAVGSIDDARKR